VMFARRIFIDVWIAAFMSLTLVCFALSERYPERRRLFLVLMYVCVGLGTLTKGPVAIVLPAAAFGAYLLVERELGRIKTMMLPLGLAIVAAIVVPWYAALYSRHGWTYITAFVMSENVARYTSGLGVQQNRGPLFYLPVLFTDSFPMSLLLVPAAAAWKHRSRVETLLWCWIAVIVVFFSLSAGKQDLYILPVVPAVAALGGIAIRRGLENGRSRAWVTMAVAAAGALLGAAGVAVIVLFETVGRAYSIDGAMLVGGLALAGGLLTLALAWLRGPAAAATLLIAALVAIDWAFVIRVLPAFERYKPVPVISAAIRDRLRPGDGVVLYKVPMPSMVYYLQRHVDGFFSRDEFVASMRGRHAYAVLWADDYRDVAGDLGPSACVAGEWNLFPAKLGDVLARRPLPKVLLVDNRCGRP